MTLVDMRTVGRWERGESMRPATKQLLDEAAIKLGLPLPEAQPR